MKYRCLGFYCSLLLGTSTLAWADIPVGTTESGGSVGRGSVQNVYGTAIDFSVKVWDRYSGLMAIDFSVKVQDRYSGLRAIDFLVGAWDRYSGLKAIDFLAEV